MCSGRKRVRAEIVKVNSDNPEASLIRYAADQIRSGEVLGMPTDTFYGLAADPFNLRAVDRVYDIKSRSIRPKNWRGHYLKSSTGWPANSGPAR
jgi:hypothetical protein